MNSFPDPPSALPLLHRSSGPTRMLGPYRIETLIETHEEGAGTVYRVFIAPGQRTNVSYHRVAEEYYYVLAGDGKAILDGREHLVRTGDFLRLPPGTTHGFVAGPDGLLLLDVHTPGCRPDRDTYFTDATPEGFQVLPDAVSQAGQTPGQGQQ